MKLRKPLYPKLFTPETPLAPEAYQTGPNPFGSTGNASFLQNPESNFARTSNQSDLSISQPSIIPLSVFKVNVAETLQETEEVLQSCDQKRVFDWISHLIFVKLWSPIPSSCLAFFRILWGLIMCYESLTYTFLNYAKLHTLVNYNFRFKYYLFEWAEPFSGNGNYYLIYMLIFSSFCVSCGFLYRLNAILFFFGFTYLFLLDATHYLNHFYLVCIISFLIIFLPLNAYWAVDNFLFPRTYRTYVPYWTLWVFRTLISVVYFYAGVAKMNEDWLRGEPLIHWLHSRQDIYLLGKLFEGPYLGILFSYAAILLDTFIGITLLIPKLRILCFLTLAFFHIMNKIIFNIGVFPWMMLASTTLYFEPDWLLRLIAWFNRKPYFRDPVTTKLPNDYAKKGQKLTKKQIMILICLSIFLLYQVLVPLRHLLYPGNVNWTEEGHYYSWRMKLREKKGIPKFFVTDTYFNETLEVDFYRYLDPRQASKMSCRPQLLHFFAHHIADKYYQDYGRKPKVLAKIVCSLNYRPHQYMVRPNVDLIAYPLWEEPRPWIIPLVPLGIKKHRDFVPKEEVIEMKKKTFSTEKKYRLR